MSVPKELRRPGVVTTVLSKKPIFLMLGLIGVIIMLLVFSIFDESSSKLNTKQQTVLIEPGVPTTTDEEGLNLPKAPEVRGVIAEKSVSEEDVKPVNEPIQVIPAPESKTDPTKDALDKLRKKQRLEILQYRFEQQRAALESKLITYQKDTPVFSSDDQNNGTPRLLALNRELTQAKSKLNKLRPKTGSDGSMAAASGPGGSPNSHALEFEVMETGGTDSKWDNGYSMDESTNALSIKTGSILPSVLITGINSTLPGYISSQISQDVWDTATGDNLLIPQGTKIFGQYKNQVLMGQERLFVAWQRLIFPDGRTMTLSDMPGTDQLGYSGLKDQVDNHYFRIYGHALLMSLVTGATAFAIDSLDSNTSDSTTFSESMGSALAEQMGQTTMSLLAKHMDMSPTLKIRPGYRLNVIVVKDLEFSEPYEGKI